MQKRFSIAGVGGHVARLHLERTVRQNGLPLIYGHEILSRRTLVRDKNAARVP